MLSRFLTSPCLGHLICKMQTQYAFCIRPGVVGRFTSGDIKPLRHASNTGRCAQSQPYVRPTQGHRLGVVPALQKVTGMGCRHNTIPEWGHGDCTGAWGWSRKTWRRGFWKVDREDGLSISNGRRDGGTPYAEWQARRRGCLSDYPRLLSPLPSLLLLDHVKMKDKPQEKSSIHKAGKISLALLSDKHLSSFLDKYCERGPGKKTPTKD